MSNLSLPPDAAAAAFIRLEMLNECAKPLRPAAAAAAAAAAVDGLYIRWW